MPGPDEIERGRAGRWEETASLEQKAAGTIDGAHAQPWNTAYCCLIVHWLPNPGVTPVNGV